MIRDKQRNGPRDSGILGLTLVLGLALVIIAIIIAPVPDAAADDRCHVLTVTMEGEGEIPTAEPKNSDTCNLEEYLKDAVIELTATPADGWRVMKWEGTQDDASVSTTNIAKMPDKAHTVKVIYEEIPAACNTLTLSHTGGGEDPTADPAKSDECETAGTYVVEEAITLTAAPAEGWHVSGWSGTDNDSSKDPTNVLTMPEAEVKVAVIYKEINYRAYIPAIFSEWPEWQRAGGDLANLYTATACRADPSTRYAGARTALYQWASNSWSKVENAPVNVRDFLFLNEQNNEPNCDDILAASYTAGVFQLTKNEWKPVGPDNLPTARSLVVRGDDIFLATQKGLYHRLKTTGLGERWTQLNSEDITRISLAGGARIYAAVFGEGVWFNDSCIELTAEKCKWIPVGKPEFNDMFDVVGSPTGNPPTWAVMATVRGIYYWNNNKWNQPADPTHAPSGNVFALAQDGNRIFAGVQNGGVWESFDYGKTWSKLGELPAYTIIDLVFVQGHGLYAATPNEGVWRWPSP